MTQRTWDGRPARTIVFHNTPETLPPRALNAKPRPQTVSTTALPAKPAFVPPTPARGRPTPQRLSYSQIEDYAKCGYRFYLKRILNLPNAEAPPPILEGEAEESTTIDAKTRGTIVHKALEDLDFDQPEAPNPETIRLLADEELTDDEVEDIRELIAAFARSPLCRRLTQAQRITREAEFNFAIEPDGSGPLVRGFVDVLAREHGRHAPGHRLQDRPHPREPHGGRVRRRLLRDPARHLRARRPARRSAHRRGQLLPTRAARRARHHDVHRPRRARPREPHHGARARHPHARLSGHPTPAPRAVRRLSRPSGALLAPAGRDAQACAGSLVGSTGPS